MPVDDGDPSLETEQDDAAPVATQPSDDDFAPYDPRTVTTTSPGPPLSAAPALDQEPHPVVDGPKFDEKWRQPFEGLLFLGALSKSFSWVGHSFKIRTMKTDEVLEIGLLHKPYVGTLSEIKAYQALVAAACTMQVDGQPVAVPLTVDAATDSQLEARFRYISGHWFPPIIDKIYTEVLDLEKVSTEVLIAMGESSGQE